LAAAGTAGDVTVPGGAAPGGLDWDWNRVLTPRVVLLMLPVAGLVLWAYPYWFPGHRWELIWRNDSAWGHGYLIPFIAVLIAHYRLKERLPRRIEPCVWGVVPILAGFIIRIWSRVMKYGYPGEATFLLVVAGVVLLMLGWEMFKALWVPVLYLGLMIPWNTRYYEGVALPLQTLAAAAGEQFLRLFGMSVARRGNVLELPSGEIAVAEACSGLHLLFAFVALGVMMAFIYRRPLWERAVIMASSVPIAVFCNMVRVTLMSITSDHLFFERKAVLAGGTTWMPGAVLGMFKGVTVAEQIADFRQTVLNPESYLHQSFGFVMLGLAFVIMWAELRFIDMFFVEEETAGGDAPAPTHGADAEPAS